MCGVRPWRRGRPRGEERGERVTSVLIGASKPEQLDDSLRCLENLAFSAEELAALEGIL